LILIRGDFFFQMAIFGKVAILCTLALICSLVQAQTNDYDVSLNIGSFLWIPVWNSNQLKMYSTLNNCGESRDNSQMYAQIWKGSTSVTSITECTTTSLDLPSGTDYSLKIFVFNNIIKTVNFNITTSQTTTLTTELSGVLARVKYSYNLNNAPPTGYICHSFNGFGFSHYVYIWSYSYSQGGRTWWHVWMPANNITQTWSLQPYCENGVSAAQNIQVVANHYYQIGLNFTSTTSSNGYFYPQISWKGTPLNNLGIYLYVNSWHLASGNYYSLGSWWNGLPVGTYNISYSGALYALPMITGTFTVTAGGYSSTVIIN
jgi:hypothetical protein